MKISFFFFGNFPTEILTLDLYLSIKTFAIQSLPSWLVLALNNSICKKEKKLFERPKSQLRNQQ